MLDGGDFPRPASELTPDQKRSLSMIKKVGANAENFVWGVEQTIQFAELIYNGISHVAIILRSRTS